MASLKDRSRILTQKSMATWNVVNIARKVALGPSPVAVFDDDTGIFIHGVVSRFTFLEPESPPLQQREDRSHPSWHKFNREWTRIDANAEKAHGL